MPAKVAILHHGYIPHYRVPLFEMLARRGRADYTVFHGTPPSWIGVEAAKGPFAFRERFVANREFRLGPGTAVYQPVVREILGGGYDAVVLSAEVKFLSNVVLALLAPLRRTAVLYWGFGYHPQRGFRDSDTPRRGFFGGVNSLKDGLTRLSDGYLAYTETGADKLARIGYPRERVFVMHNTIDMTEQCRLYDAVRADDPAAIRRELGLQPESIVFTYIGRLVQFKRVDLLIEATRAANRDRAGKPPIEAVVIGAGPLEAELRAQASTVPQVHFTGGLPPDARVARALKISAGVVITGAVGLLINHAFAHGKPVITRDNEAHGAEIEYLHHDENGLVVPGDVEAYARVLGDFADAPDWQARLAEGALRARASLSLEALVERFDEAIELTVARRKAGWFSPLAPSQR